MHLCHDVYCYDDSEHLCHDVHCTSNRKERKEMQDYSNGVASGVSQGKQKPKMAGEASTIEAPSIGSKMIDSPGASAVPNIGSTGSPISPETGPVPYPSDVKV